MTAIPTPHSPHDAPALRVARAALRRCYVELDAIRTEDRTVPELSDTLKTMAHDVGVDIESVQPRLELA